MMKRAVRRSKVQSLEDQRWATAYHEAGHAAAAYFLEWPFTGVHIVADGNRGLLEELEREPVVFEGYPQDQAILDVLEKRIIEGFAGLAAETRYTGRLHRKYGSAYFESAFNLALVRHSEGTLNEVDAFLKYVWVRAHAFMGQEEHWVAVVALAGALLQREKLTRDEAVEVMCAALEPLWLQHGSPRSEVEKLKPLHTGGVVRDISFGKFLIRRGLRTLVGQLKSSRLKPTGCSIAQRDRDSGDRAC